MQQIMHVEGGGRGKQLVELEVLKCFNPMLSNPYAGHSEYQLQQHLSSGYAVHSSATISTPRRWDARPHTPTYSPY